MELESRATPSLCQSTVLVKALTWFVLALGVCFALGTMGTIFSAIAAIIGHHYRGSYFSAILRQDAAFFAVKDHDPGSLTAQ